MEKKYKTFALTTFFFLLTCLLLKYPQESLTLSATGLTLWFNRMIPTLLPFMILSGIMIRMNLTERFVRLLRPLLYPFFRISSNGIYVLCIGFLCGFPMGAKVTADMYEQKKISREEASYLLSFCNNIGPVYFISFVLPTIKADALGLCLFGMYGIPLIYGIVLRYTVFYHQLDQAYLPGNLGQLKAAGKTNPASLLDAVDESITSGLISIAKLGGYMVLFNLLNLPFTVGLKHFLSLFQAAKIACLLEITSGISSIGAASPLFVLVILPFGGCSCIAQTYSMIRNTDLSIKSYIIHKLVLTAITATYYFLWAIQSVTR